MEELDPKKFDWPIPAPGSAEEQALHESLQYAAEGLRKDLAQVGELTASNFVDMLARWFDRSPAPTESVSAIERLFRFNPGDIPEFVETALDNREAFGRFFVLLGHTRFLGRYLVRHAWREFLALDDDAVAREVTRGEVADGARERIRNGEEPRVALRRNHRWFALRVLAQEVLLKRPLEQVAAEISALADAALEVALEHAREKVAARGGGPPGRDFRFCVIALGKHGADELNYSSDIDVMFVFDGGDRNAARHAVRIAEALIPLIDEQTEDGNVFRVDTRLRPEGKRGRLVRSLDATVRYYFSFGSTWERQALIKARPAAGDLELGAGLIKRLHPWVYRKYLSIEEINQIKSLKRRIEQRTEERNEAHLDVKTGFGGIRDIEFVTQFLQLMNGGRFPEVCERATLPALEKLAAMGALRRNEAEVLADAYRFLRSVEHRLQVWDGVQTHNLPGDPHGLTRLGRAMGYRGDAHADPARELVHRLQAHTLQSRGLMVRLFADLFDEHASAEEGELVLDPDMTAEQAAHVLERYRFRETARAFRAIRDLARESSEHSMYEARARKYLASLMPGLLQFCGDSPDPDFTLGNLERVTSAMGAKAIFFELIAEDPRALEVFGSIAAHSTWLTDILSRRPGLVDEFIDELQTFTSLDSRALREQLRERMQYATDIADALAWEHDVELLRIGFFDLTGRTPLPETLRELCALAEVLLEAAVDVAISAELEREVDGRPVGESVRSDPQDHLAVIGMGKLGSGAMNYASDLDLVFAYDPGAFEDHAQAQAFYTRVVRRTRDLLETTSVTGKLFEVDLRLRPRGRASSLAVTVDELDKYLHTEAGFWERLAGCRARVLNPDTFAGAACVRVFEEFVYGGDADAAATLEMRERLQGESPRNALKRGPGGTLDVEFLLAHLQLKHGREIPGLKQPDLWEVLEVARENGLIDPQSYDAIGGAYAFVRQVVNRLQILDGVSRHELPEGQELEVFAMRMGYKSGHGMTAAQQLTEELDWHRGNARRAFEIIVT